MKLGALALFLAASLAAVYLHVAGRSSSFASYSEEQLRTLEQAYQRAATAKPGPGAVRNRGIEAMVSLSLLQDEQARRHRLIGAIAIAALAALGLIVLLRGSRPRRTDEDARFVQRLGTPEEALALERVKAAKLLGVSLDSPPHVVEAALNAQLLTRDPARLEGLAPDLRRIALEQREAFRRARDSLLGRAQRSPERPSSEVRATPPI